MNKFQAALHHTRVLIDNGEPYLCPALTRVSVEHPNLAEAVKHVKQHIKDQLEGAPTLGGFVSFYLDTRLIGDLNLGALARLAWIDKMMEQLA